MVVPWLRPGIEDRRNRAKDRVDRGQVGSLSPIAFETREREVTACGLAPMSERDHVVDLMREGKVVFMDATVFAAASGSFEDLSAQRGGDRQPSHPIRPALPTLSARVP